MSIKIIAEQLRTLTYAEMMEFATYFAETIKGRGEDGIEWDEESPEDWADLFNTWAENYLDNEEPENA